MIIYNKIVYYLFVSADRQTFLGFEMTGNLRDTSPLIGDSVVQTFVCWEEIIPLVGLDGQKRVVTAVDIPRASSHHIP